MIFNQNELLTIDKNKHIIYDYFYLPMIKKENVISFPLAPLHSKFSGLYFNLIKIGEKSYKIQCFIDQEEILESEFFYRKFVYFSRNSDIKKTLESIIKGIKSFVKDTYQEEVDKNISISNTIKEF
jgi:hypothetical protein